MQEFAERWEVDRYLSTGGYLGENARPFFVALPKDRGTITNEDYRRQISVVDTDILKQLRENVAGGFDEERFGNHVGFGKLRLYLEAELQRRYLSSHVTWVNSVNTATFKGDYSFILAAVWLFNSREL